MTWQDDYRAHEIWVSANNALNSLSEADGTEHDLSRLRELLAYVAGFEDTPHVTLSQAHLDVVKQTVDLIGDYLPDNLATVFGQVRMPNGSVTFPVDHLSQQVRAWPVQGAAALTGLGKKAQAVDSALEALQSRLDEALTGFSTASDEAKAAWTKDLEAYSASAAERAKEVKADLQRIAAAAAESEKTTEEQKSRLDKALTNQQQLFADQQRDREKEWLDWAQQGDARLEAHMTRMAEYEEQSRKVLSAVGVNSTATDYGEYANKQADVADRWRVGAVVALSVAAAAFLGAAAASFFGLGTDLDWWQVVFQKVGAPAGAAAVGWFLARESGQHRAQERRARQVQLTLTALEPFIANLPVEDQQSIRADTARMVFGHSDPRGVREKSQTAPEPNAG